MLFCLCPAPLAFLCSHYHSGKQSIISSVGKILSSLHISYATQETVLLCFFSFNLSSRKIRKFFILFLLHWSFLIKVNCLLFPEVIFFLWLFLNRKSKIIQLAALSWLLFLSVINSLWCLMVLIDDQIYMGWCSVPQTFLPFWIFSDKKAAKLNLIYSSYRHINSLETRWLHWNCLVEHVQK